MRQFHDDAAAEPKCANPLTAQDLRRERVKLAHELLVLIQEDIGVAAASNGKFTVVGLLKK